MLDIREHGGNFGGGGGKYKKGSLIPAVELGLSSPVIEPLSNENVNLEYVGYDEDSYFLCSKPSYQLRIMDKKTNLLKRTVTLANLPQKIIKDTIGNYFILYGFRVEKRNGDWEIISNNSSHNMDLTNYFSDMEIHNGVLNLYLQSSNAVYIYRCTLDLSTLEQKYYIPANSKNAFFVTENYVYVMEENTSTPGLSKINKTTYEKTIVCSLSGNYKSVIFVDEQTEEFITSYSVSPRYIRKIKKDGSVVYSHALDNVLDTPYLAIYHPPTKSCFFSFGTGTLYILSPAGLLESIRYLGYRFYTSTFTFSRNTHSGMIAGRFYGYPTSYNVVRPYGGYLATHLQIQ